MITISRSQFAALAAVALATNAGASPPANRHGEQIVRVGALKVLPISGMKRVSIPKMRCGFFDTSGSFECSVTYLGRAISRPDELQHYSTKLDGSLMSQYHYSGNRVFRRTYKKVCLGRCNSVMSVFFVNKNGRSTKITQFAFLFKHGKYVLEESYNYSHGPGNAPASFDSAFSQLVHQIATQLSTAGGGARTPIHREKR